jgi:hypothetical protein
MRLVLAGVLLAAACGSRPAAGPAWPKQAEHETDGGESLAPRAKASAVAAAEDDDDEIAVAPADKPEAKPEVKAETPKAATPSAPPPPPEDIVITTEEIVIEVDD